MPENSVDHLAHLLRESCAIVFTAYDCLKNNIHDGFFCLVSIVGCLYMNAWLSISLLMVIIGLFSLTAWITTKPARPKKKRQRPSEGSDKEKDAAAIAADTGTITTSNPASGHGNSLSGTSRGSTNIDSLPQPQLRKSAQQALEAEQDAAQDEHDGEEEESSRYITEGILHLRTMRQCNATDEFYLKVKGALGMEETDLIPDRWDDAIAAGWVAATIGMIFVAVYIIGVVLMAWRKVSDVGVIVGVLFILFGVADRLGALVQTKRRIPDVKLAYLDILAILHRKPHVQYSNVDPENMLSPVQLIKDKVERQKVDNFISIIFESVKFAYPSRPADQILRGLNIKIERGDQVALTGKDQEGRSGGADGYGVETFLCH